MCTNRITGYPVHSTLCLIALEKRRAALSFSTLILPVLSQSTSFLTWRSWR
ncbi:hypothetical protein H0X06_03570 [Candidatus Dependentiae bacterium]|nr:hypothetical protein [Candidatus Dependentiae bacterium]